MLKAGGCREVRWGLRDTGGSQEGCGEESGADPCLLANRSAGAPQAMCSISRTHL